MAVGTLEGMNFHDLFSREWRSKWFFCDVWDCGYPAFLKKNDFFLFLFFLCF
jgi:hypothetical protein